MKQLFLLLRKQMGFLTTMSLYTVVVVFQNTQFIINTNELLVPKGQNLTISADSGYPLLESGHEAEHMEAFQQVNDIYSRSLYQYLGTVGRPATRRDTGVSTYGRITIPAISRCAMALPFEFGSPSTMKSILSVYGTSQFYGSSWAESYLQMTMARSFDIFEWTMDAIEASNGLYSLDTWPIQFRGACNIYDQLKEWRTRK